MGVLLTGLITTAVWFMASRVATTGSRGAQKELDRASKLDLVNAQDILKRRKLRDRRELRDFVQTSPRKTPLEGALLQRGLKTRGF